jgi:hypothetical protein
MPSTIAILIGGAACAWTRPSADTPSAKAPNFKAARRQIKLVFIA